LSPYEGLAGFKEPFDFFNLKTNIYQLNICSSFNPSFVASLLSQGASMADNPHQPAKMVNLVDGLLKQKTH